MKLIQELIGLSRSKPLPKYLSDTLDVKAKGDDDVTHNGKKYVRSGPKSPTGKAGQWKLQDNQMNEARVEGDLADLIERYCDINKLYHFEGGRGVNNFEKIIKVLGYDNMDRFLEDNSGCLEAMIQWLGKTNLPEWLEAMQAEVPPVDDDKDRE